MSEITARISTLPTPPTREDPDNFDSRADSFLAALPTFQSEANEVAEQINDVLPAIDQANEASENLITSLAGTALSGTSTTSLTVGTGSKSLTTGTGKEWVPGHRVKIVYQSDYTIYMEGEVTSYNSSTGAMGVSVDLTQGSGTYTSWSVFTIPKLDSIRIQAGEDLSANDPVSISSEDGHIYKFRHYSDSFNGSMPETISNSYGGLSVDKLDSTHIILAYTDSSNHGKVVVGTISNKSITWGTAVTFNAASTAYVDVVALTSTSFIVVYQDGGNSGYGTAIAGTVSGTTITLGSETVFWNSGTATYTQVCRLDDTHFFTGFGGNDGSNTYLRSVAGSVSGTTISFGTVVIASTASAGTYTKVASLDSTHVAIQDMNRLRIAEITLSTNTISYPTSETTVSGRYSLAVLDSSHFVSGRLYSNNLTVYLYSVSGTTITEKDNSQIVTGGVSNALESFAIDSTRVAILFQSTDESSESIAIVSCSSTEIQSADVELKTQIEDSYAKSGCMIDSTQFVHLTHSNYQIHDLGLIFSDLIGFVKSAVTSGDQADVYHGGILTGLSNLLTGRTYNLDGDGTLTPSTRSPETDIRAGIAKSSTELLIQL